MKDYKLLESLYYMIRYNKQTDVESVLETTDLDEFVKDLLEETTRDREYLSRLKTVLEILHYIDNECEIPTPVSDDIYDKLSAIYEDLSSNIMFGTDIRFGSISNDNIGYHKYPELRGTLGKVHFDYKEDIPKNDSRKSLEGFYDQIIKKLNLANVSIPTHVLIDCDLKYDGVSHIFECSYNKITRVLTRYDVDDNIGKDITHLYRNTDFKLNIPECFYQLELYGVKTETYMKQKDLERYQDTYKDSKCNRRSAITSIVNRSDSEMTSDLISYISNQPFQIATESFIELPPYVQDWMYIGIIDKHHQYIRIDGLVKNYIDLNDKNLFMQTVITSIPQIQQASIQNDIPIDGVVVSIIEPSVVKYIGRTNHVNRFQIAYKIPAGIKKTKLSSIIYQVGSVSGKITPVAVVEPVVINGSTITNASLSNFAKLERLNLHIGDEVKIRYDIIPKLVVDEDCVVSNAPGIKPITHCPLCGSELIKDRCVNIHCKSKIPGRIYNFVNKLGIKGLGKQTINDFVERGFLTNIEDLYLLENHREEIQSLPGYGETSFNNIMANIFHKLSVYPHEIVGSIGIPNISIKIMKEICHRIPIEEFLNPLSILDKLTTIPGIGAKRAEQIVLGLSDNVDTIRFLISRLDIKEYLDQEKPIGYITFTNIRDYDFEKFLQSQNYEVLDSFQTKLDYVIVPDVPLNKKSEKVKKSEKYGITIIPISEAKKLFNYTPVKRG